MSLLRPWLLATRPKTLPAGAAPVAVGVACASTVVAVRWDAAVGCLVGAILIQIGCNFANDAFDAVKGADTADRLGPQRAVASGQISFRAMLVGTAVALLAALAVGLWLGALAGWPIVAVGVVCLVCALAYTGGPLPLAYLGLGDLFTFVFFGLVAVLGSAWVQCAASLPGGWSSGSWPLLGGETILGLPVAWWFAGAGVGFQATAIICVNNLRDIPTDGPAGKRTVCVRLGDAASRWYYGAIHALAAGAWLAATPFVVPSQREPFVLAGALAFLGGQLLARAIRPVQGTALNRFLGLTAALELATAAAFVGAVIASGVR